MKAAILEKINNPLVIKEIGLTPLKTGQILVKVLMSGLCGSQIHEITGAKGNEKFLPHMMGHEGCGIVEEIGEGVTNVKIGEKVVMHWRVGKGIESESPKYILDNKIITSGKVTTLTEYAICSENRLTSVPLNTPESLCCMLGCSLTTAFGVIDNDANLKLGETVMILGAGGVGLNLIQAAKLKGARYIFVIEKNESKKKLIENLGGYTNVEKFFPPDVIIDTTGNSFLISKWLPFLASGGRFILVGQGSSEFSFHVNNAMNLFEGDGKKIIASQGGQTNPAKDISRIIKYFDSGAFSLIDITEFGYTLETINKAFDKLRSGDAKRIMVNINHL